MEISVIKCVIAVMLVRAIMKVFVREMEKATLVLVNQVGIYQLLISLTKYGNIFKYVPKKIHI